MKTSSEARSSSSNAVATRGPVSAYSEDLYLGLLTNINGSERRVEALCRLALRHLPQAIETWSAVRRAFVNAADPQSIADLDGETNRALWCLVDALLKHAPGVFAPLISPRLLEYVTQQTPLQLMAAAATSPSALHLFGRVSVSDDGAVSSSTTDAAHRAASWSWWETLVLSWQSLLPADVFATVRHYVTQRKSTAELDGALLRAGNNTGVTDGPAANAPASTADMQALEEEWQALRYLCSTAGGRTAQRSGAAAGGGGFGMYGAIGSFSFEELLASVARPTDAAAASAAAVVGRNDSQQQPHNPATTQARSNSSGRGGNESVDEDNDEEGEIYVPSFIPGAKARALPERNLPAQRRRREARRRTRDEDY